MSRSLEARLQRLERYTPGEGEPKQLPPNVWEALLFGRAGVPLTEAESALLDRIEAEAAARPDGAEEIERRVRELPAGPAADALTERPSFGKQKGERT